MSLSPKMVHPHRSASGGTEHLNGSRNKYTKHNSFFNSVSDGAVTLYKLFNIYIYNSVLTCRQHIINSSASAPPNATKIAVKKVSDVVVCMFGPKL